MKKSNNKTGPPKSLWFSVVGAMVLLSMLLYACAPAPTPEPTAVPTNVPQPTAVPLEDQSAIWAAWEEGPMSAAYDIGKGPNTMCTRCHSPMNWKPGSKVGPSSAPPNPTCVTCKFPNNKMFPNFNIAPSFAEGGMDLVTEDQWIGIPCAQCHQVDALTGLASHEIAWLQPIVMTYEKLNTPDELCTKCHSAYGGNKEGSAGLTMSRAIVVGGTAHLNFAGEWPLADRPKYCIDCHDPHSSAVKQCEDCHADTADTHTKVAAMMDKVTCQGCHDASGAAVGRVGDGLFTTILVTPPGPRSPGSSAEIVSHSSQWLVLCNRCHMAGNTYGLTVLTDKGVVVPPPTPAPTPTP